MAGERCTQTNTPMPTNGRLGELSKASALWPTILTHTHTALSLSSQRRLCLSFIAHPSVHKGWLAHVLKSHLLCQVHSTSPPYMQWYRRSSLCQRGAYRATHTDQMRRFGAKEIEGKSRFSLRFVLDERDCTWTGKCKWPDATKPTKESLYLCSSNVVQSINFTSRFSCCDFMTQPTDGK